MSHCFDLPDVTIERWQLRKVAIDPAHQNRLGVRNPKGKRLDIFRDAPYSALILPSAHGCRIAAENSCCRLAACRGSVISHFTRWRKSPAADHVPFLYSARPVCTIYGCARHHSRLKGCALAIRPAPASAEPALLVSRKYRPPSQSESGNNSMEPLMAEENSNPAGPH